MKVNTELIFSLCLGLQACTHYIHGNFQSCLTLKQIYTEWRPHFSLQIICSIQEAIPKELENYSKESELGMVLYIGNPRCSGSLRQGIVSLKLALISLLGLLLL